MEGGIEEMSSNGCFSDDVVLTAITQRKNLRNASKSVAIFSNKVSSLSWVSGGIAIHIP